MHRAWTPSLAHERGLPPDRCHRCHQAAWAAVCGGRVGLAGTQDAPGGGPNRGRWRGGEETACRGKARGYGPNDIDLAPRPRLHWVETPKGYWVVNLADRMLRVRPDGQGTYRLEVRKRDERSYTRLVDRLSQEFCFGIASDTARDAQILHMVQEGARWRQNAPSPKQEAFARKLGARIEPGGRSGEVSDAIVAITGE